MNGAESGLASIIKETGQANLNEMNDQLRGALNDVSRLVRTMRRPFTQRSLPQHGSSLKEQETAHGAALANYARNLEEMSLRAYDVDIARIVSLLKPLQNVETSADHWLRPPHARIKQKNAGAL